jgi:hypothetical protein
MLDDISTETIYDGSVPCRRCGMVMTPLEVMYSYDGRTCPACRNAKMEAHVRGGMSGK